MPTIKDRRSWFGFGARPRLPDYLQTGKGKRVRSRTDKDQRIKLPAVRGRRLKGLDEFEEPEFVGRMARIARQRNLEWWGLMLAAFTVGGAIGWLLI